MISRGHSKFQPVFSCSLNSAGTCSVILCTLATNNLCLLSPCSAASGVPGPQSVLLHPMHCISKVPNSYLCWCTEVLQYWEASEAGYRKSQTWDLYCVTLRFQTQRFFCYPVLVKPGKWPENHCRDQLCGSNSSCCCLLWNAAGERVNSGILSPQ